MLKHPTIHVFIELVSTEETDNLLGWVLVAVYLPGVEVDAEVDEEGFVVLVDGLVAL